MKRMVSKYVLPAGSAQTTVESIKNAEPSADISSLTAEIRLLSEDAEKNWCAMGSRLSKIVEERLYRATGYRSFDDYCRTAVNYSRQHAYKLIKLVHFIQQMWRDAKTEEECNIVLRALQLNFSKLYVLHTLPIDLLIKYFQEGIDILPSRRFRGGKLSIEAASVAQLKTALSAKIARGTVSGGTALIIESDEKMASILRRALTNAHIRALIAHSLEEAQTIIRESYDYVVLRSSMVNCLTNCSRKW